MIIAPRLPLLPPDAQTISRDLAVLLDETRLVVFNASGEIYTCSRDDREGMRLAAAMFSSLKLATPTALARALEMRPETVFRHRRLFTEGGVAAVRSKKRGPKGRSKLIGEVCARAQRLLDEGWSIRRVAAEVGVVEGTLRHALKRGELRRSVGMRPGSAGVPAKKEELSRPAVRAEQDRASEQGVAVKRSGERALASVGLLPEAVPSFEPAEAVAGAGVLLALPALLSEGLIDVGEGVYGKLRNGFFGLRSVLLTLAFMALLRIKTPEQLTEHAPGELGILLGLDRAPEVKTLRRKLREMGLRQLARAFTQKLTERWAKSEPQELAILYVDGHVRPYNGRKHMLPKHHVQQRGRPMPGTKDFHVNDRRADPLLFVTAEATESLLEMLDTKLLPEVRRLMGRRRATIVFDREGWSPEKFAKWKKQGFDVLTYRKGEQSRWQKRFFQPVQGKVGGEKVNYQLAEREVKLTNGLKVREIRRLTNDGHQTAVITTSDKLPLLAGAHRMFSRWRQENFFRYMKHEFALDHLCTHQVEPADPKRSVPHPERSRLEKKLQSVRTARTRLLERALQIAPGKKTRVGKRQVDQVELDQLILKHETEARKLSARIGKMPKHVPVEEVLEPEQIVQLERERKVIVDAIKLTAYRAESSLARLVEPFFRRHQQEARKFLKSIFRATADVIPDHHNKRLTVRFHGLASPRATRALAELCALVNDKAPCFPGSDLRLRFEAPPLQK